MDARIKYEIILYWSKDDDAFIAEVPELPGCAAHRHCSTMMNSTRRFFARPSAVLLEAIGRVAP